MHRRFTLLALFASAGTLGSQLPPNVARIGSSMEAFERPVTFANDTVALAGWLSLPPGPGPHPVVVFLHGGGVGPGRNPMMRTITAHLLQAGIGAFAYDKRGGGQSTGDREWSSFGDLANDALAAVAMLKARPDVRATQIGVMGFSQGGWIGPLAASRSRDIAFVIMVSGAAMSPLEQELFASRTRERTLGLSDADLDASTQLRRALLEYFGEPTSERHTRAQAALTAARTSSWLSVAQPPELRGIDGAVPPPDAVRSLRSRVPIFRWYAEQFSYDFQTPLRSLAVPTLAFFGTRDRIVPVEVSRRGLTEAFGARASNLLTVVTWPGADHGMLVAEPRDPLPLPDGYWERLLGWLRGVTTPAPAQPGSVLRSYALDVGTDGPNPYRNYVTFFGSEQGGTFLDRNMHTGTWERNGQNISWTYTSVPGLVNVFRGTLTTDAMQMSGANEGTWEGKPFALKWKSVP